MTIQSAKTFNYLTYHILYDLIRWTTAQTHWAKDIIDCIRCHCIRQYTTRNGSLSVLWIWEWPRQSPRCSVTPLTHSENHFIVCKEVKLGWMTSEYATTIYHSLAGPPQCCKTINMIVLPWKSINYCAMVRKDTKVSQTVGHDWNNHFTAWKATNKIQSVGVAPLSSLMNGLMNTSESCQPFKSLQVQNNVWGRYSVNLYWISTTVQYEWCKEAWAYASFRPVSWSQVVRHHWMLPFTVTPPIMHSHVATIYRAARWFGSKWYFHCPWWSITKFEVPTPDGHSYPWDRQVVDKLARDLQRPYTTQKWIYWLVTQNVCYEVQNAPLYSVVCHVPLTNHIVSQHEMRPYVG